MALSELVRGAGVGGGGDLHQTPLRSYAGETLRSTSHSGEIASQSGPRQTVAHWQRKSSTARQPSMQSPAAGPTGSRPHTAFRLDESLWVKVLALRGRPPAVALLLRGGGSVPRPLYSYSKELTN